MRPLKTRDLYPEIAFASGATIDEVKAVSEFFWSEVRSSLSLLTDVRIHLHELGDFTIKHWLIDKEIEKYRRIINKRSSLEGPLQEKIDRLNRAKDLLQEETQRKEFIHNHKKKSNETKSRKSAENLEK